MKISLPTQFTVIPDKKNPYMASVEIAPLYPGYGHTVGNALRRVLLSSLEGAGVTSVKLEGAEHEFMTLPSIQEEVLEIILNIKQLNVKLHGDDPQKLVLSVKGEKKVTGADFKKNSSVEVISTDQHIATLTSKDAKLELEITVEKGLGFSPVEEREKKTEVGVISIDTVFAPIRSIGYSVIDVRVGKRTDYDKLVFTLETNGTINVQEAFLEASKILVNHFNFIHERASGQDEPDEFDETKKDTEE